MRYRSAPNPIPIPTFNVGDAWSSVTRRQWFAAALSGALLACGRGEALFGAAADMSQPDSSSATMAETERAIPFDNFEAETRAKVLAVVDRPTLYRRLPVQVYECDHRMHLFLTRYPEVVVNIWQLMGITNIKVKRTGEYTVDAGDGAGTVSRVELIYGDPEKHVFLCDGYYEGPLFKRKIVGRSVLMMRTTYSLDRERRPWITDRLDVFLQVENVGADLIAKTLQSTVGKTVDANFIETTKFVNKISESAERNGSGMHSLSEKLTACEPAVRNEFGTLCLDANARAAERMAALTATPAEKQASAQAPTGATRVAPVSGRR